MATSEVYTPSTETSVGAAASIFIDDLASFEAATRGSNAVAGLYFFQQLDCLVQLAHKVADDFFARPQVYVDVDGGSAVGGGHTVSHTLSRLEGRFGYDESFPSDDQRGHIFTALFGCGIDLAQPETGQFPSLRNAVLAAATAFAETGVETGIDMLRNGFRTAAANLADYLAGVSGDSVRASRERFAALTEPVSYTVLRSPGVAHAFGVTQAPATSWPYSPDANADKLVSLASTALTPSAAITSERISTLNRTALRGAEALAMITDAGALIDSSDPQTDAELDQIIKKCYTWGVALSRGPSSWTAAAK